MPQRLRPTRRFPVALTETAYRTLRRFSAEAGITQDEALIFLLENFRSVTDEETLPHRLRLFKAELAAGKA
ncbi:hypothetical protein PSA7680_03354 [Pseudoruegeria aquimaris]|uniref:Ribbon-helix-helix protein CopG domain-containing protein n=1 Tax=Pseudoruegeria aquimaris TaxID=393663 RepID=A0A1Y5TH38_9RHOB|nr:hypothetical protein [Pseudoruegeria aquimaris]SLN63519.1 hypothetical protein PSA7680_03354 [Pseudoruegeria aquimaris]